MAIFTKITENLVMITYLTLFLPVFPFDPPENIRKPLVFGCFEGNQKGVLGRKVLKILCNHQKVLPLSLAISFYKLEFKDVKIDNGMPSLGASSFIAQIKMLIKNCNANV